MRKVDKICKKSFDEKKKKNEAKVKEKRERG